MTPTREAYLDFLRAKISNAELAGFEPPSPCEMAENEIAAPTLFDVWKETPEVAEV